MSPIHEIGSHFFIEILMYLTLLYCALILHYQPFVDKFQHQITLMNFWFTINVCYLFQQNQRDQYNQEAYDIMEKKLMIGFYSVLGINFLAVYGAPTKVLIKKCYGFYKKKIQQLLEKSKKEESSEEESSESEEEDEIDGLVRL